MFLLGFFLRGRRVDQRFNLFGGHEPRELLFRFRQEDFAQDIFFDEVPPEEERVERPQGREPQAHAGTGHVFFHHVQHPRAVVGRGRRLPRAGGTESPERLDGGPVGGHRPGRGILLGFKESEERLRQPVGWKLGAVGFLFQTVAPIGTPNGGWAVCPTSPVRAVALSKRSVAERVSTPSGDVAVIGIS